MTEPAHVHTIRRGGVWVNEIEGQGRVPGRHRTKDEASHAGREIAAALHAQHVVHNIDGSISARVNPYPR
jgi:hypothetical protein